MRELSVTEVKMLQVLQGKEPLPTDMIYVVFSYKDMPKLWKHICFLVDSGLVKRTGDHPVVYRFELTKNGIGYLKDLGQK